MAIDRGDGGSAPATGAVQYVREDELANTTDPTLGDALVGVHITGLTPLTLHALLEAPTFPSLHITGASDFDGPVGFDSPVDFNSTVNFNGGVSLPGGLTGTFAGQFNADDGTEALPSYAFTNLAGTGMYCVPGSQQLRFTTGGTARIAVSPAGTIQFAGSSALAWSSGAAGATSDLVMVRDAPNIWGLRNGANTQTIKVYGTYTDASNYERLSMTTVGTVHVIRTEQAGTGAVKALHFGVGNGRNWGIDTTGHWIAINDNATDIGASAASRPRSIYWGTQALGVDGTALLPSHSYSNENNAGWARISAGNFYFSVGGVSRVGIAATGMDLTNLAISRVATISNNQAAGINITPGNGATGNILSQVNGTNSQSFRVYGTFTDASNYERLDIAVSNTGARIGPSVLGTGVQRNLIFTLGGTDRWAINPHLLASTDNTLDIGAAGANRPRNIYIAGTVNAGGAYAGTDATLSGNLVVNGNTTLGDAAGDTLTINAGAWTLGNFTATRAFGALPAGLTNVPQTFTSSFSGDVAGTTDLRNYSFVTSATGTNPVQSVRNVNVTATTSGPAAGLQSLFAQVTTGGAGSLTSGNVFLGFFALQSTNPTAHGALVGYTVASPTVNAGNTSPSLIGFQANNLGNVGITDAIGFSCAAQANSTNHRAFQGSIAAGATNWNAYMNGTANNYFAGDVRVGTTSDFQATVLAAGTMTGATTRYGFRAGATIGSAVTAQAFGFQTSLQTQATAFTLTDLIHFGAGTSTVGAGSTVTNQVGFNVGSTLTGATNNYGFAAAVPAGANRWNFYASGTAQNFFNGVTGIGIAASSTAALALAASTTGVASLRLPHGVAPTAPVDGDTWTTTLGVFARINGVTVGPLGTGGGGGPSLGVASVIRTNAQNIGTNITFLGTENGSTVGPVTIDPGFTVDVTTGSRWVIL